MSIKKKQKHLSSFKALRFWRHSLMEYNTAYPESYSNKTSPLKSPLKADFNSVLSVINIQTIN